MALVDTLLLKLRMRTLILLIALVPTVALAQGGPTCSAVPKALYGITLGSFENYPGNLRKGLRREGTAEVIAEVGFESVEGKTDEIAYPRIMAFFDRGRFTGTMAAARVESEKDQGFARIVTFVGAAANSTPTIANGKATFKCEGAMELSVEPAKWNDGPAVMVRAMDADALKQMNAYIAEYCADPKRRRPKDACKK